jgi:hemoglobin
LVIYHEKLLVSPLLKANMTQPATSLYQRIGGYDVIAAVIDDLLAILHDDPGFARFFGGRSADSVIRIRHLLVDQMCALRGGPCHYIGREMKTSHRGLGISNAEFLALFERYRDDIVEA